MHSARYLWWLWCAFVVGVQLELQPVSGYFFNSRAVCLGPHARELQPHPYDCTRFVQCAHGRAHVHRCPARLHWNARLQLCDYPHSAECSLTFRLSSGLTTTMTTMTPTSVTTACTSGSYYQHEWDCGQFYYCERGMRVRFACANGLHWSHGRQHCDDPHNVRCALGVAPATINGAIHPACPSADESHRTIYLQYPHDCKRFLVCSQGRAWIFDCPWGLQWSMALGRCEYAFLARCTIDATDAGPDRGGHLLHTIDESLGNSVEVDKIVPSADVYIGNTFIKESLVDVNDASQDYDSPSQASMETSSPQSSVVPAIPSRDTTTEAIVAVALAKQSSTVTSNAVDSSTRDNTIEITETSGNQGKPTTTLAIVYDAIETITPPSIVSNVNVNENYKSTEAAAIDETRTISQDRDPAVTSSTTATASDQLIDLTNFPTFSESSAATKSNDNTNIYFGGITSGSTPKIVEDITEMVQENYRITEASAIDETTTINQDRDPAVTSSTTSTASDQLIDLTNFPTFSESSAATTSNDSTNIDFGGITSGSTPKIAEDITEIVQENYRSTEASAIDETTTINQDRDPAVTSSTTSTASDQLIDLNSFPTFSESSAATTSNESTSIDFGGITSGSTPKIAEDITEMVQKNYRITEASAIDETTTISQDRDPAVTSSTTATASDQLIDITNFPTFSESSAATTSNESTSIDFGGITSGSTPKIAEDITEMVQENYRITEASAIDETTTINQDRDPAVTSSTTSTASDQLIDLNSFPTFSEFSAVTTNNESTSIDFGGITSGSTPKIAEEITEMVQENYRSTEASAIDETTTINQDRDPAVTSSTTAIASDQLTDLTNFPTFSESSAATTSNDSTTTDFRGVTSENISQIVEDSTELSQDTTETTATTSSNEELDNSEVGKSLIILEDPQIPLADYDDTSTTTKFTIRVFEETSTPNVDEQLYANYDDGDLIAAVNIDEQQDREVDQAKYDYQDLSDAVNINEQPRIEEEITDWRMTQAPNANFNSGDLIGSDAQTNLVSTRYKKVGSLYTPNVLLMNSIPTLNQAESSVNIIAESKNNKLDDVEKSPAHAIAAGKIATQPLRPASVNIDDKFKSSNHDQSITNSKTMTHSIVVHDPRLPFRAPQCRDPSGRVKFAAAHFEQYYQCFEGYAYLLNCFEGDVFSVSDARCTQKHFVDGLTNQ